MNRREKKQKPKLGHKPRLGESKQEKVSPTDPTNYMYIYCAFMYDPFCGFQKSLDYKEIEEKEAKEESKAQKVTKFLLENEEGGQKKYNMNDLVAKRKETKKEMKNKK